MSREFTTPVYSPSQIHLASDEVLQRLAGKKWIYDIEVYENFVLIAAMEFDSGWCVFFEAGRTTEIDRRKLHWFVKHNTLIGFNSINYDQYILWAALQGCYVEQIKSLSDSIILSDNRAYKVAKKYNIKVGDFDHIDLMQVAPAAASFLSLKHYGARMHVKKLQDLPYAVNTSLTEQQKYEVKNYCINDLTQTAHLYAKLKKQIQLREEMGNTYNSDLRSLSDAQIAEKAIGSELLKLTGVKHRKPPLPQGEFFRYVDPGFLCFETEQLQLLFNEIKTTDFTVNEKGQIRIGADLTKATNLWKIRIGFTDYKLGIGGLHSSEKSRSVYSTDTHQLYDRDVESYYPKIILNQGLYPQHIGEPFLAIYRRIYDKRVAAKAAGQKSVADALKITINGCFGKLGSMWSIFYSPHLLTQVTLTGQLSLLLLVERLETAGVPVVSANTDGIVINCPRSLTQSYLAIVRQWERDTDFKTEETVYDAVHSRDVNSYIAICPDGKIKAKGEYVNDMTMQNVDREQLMTNPNFSICSEAAMLYLQTCRGPNPKTIDTTIKKCRDLRKFLAIKKVTGGAIKDKQYLGKVIRWYIREDDFGAIYSKEENAAGITNRVAESDGGCPVMELPAEFPKDINYRWYIKRAHKILKTVGFGKIERNQLSLFS